MAIAGSQWMKRPSNHESDELFTNCGDILYILSVLSMIGFIFGIAMVCLGCNPETQSTCLSYNPIRATVYDFSVSNHSCTVCNNYFHDNCASERIETCYSSFVEFSYSFGGADKECYDQIMTDVLSAKHALEIAENKYALGHSYFMLTKKYDATSKCFVEPELAGFWILGSVLLTLTSAVFACWICLFCYDKDLVIIPVNLRRERGYFNQVHHDGRRVHPEVSTNVENTAGVTSVDINHDPELFANDLERAEIAEKTTAVDDSNEVIRRAHIIDDQTLDATCDNATRAKDVKEDEDDDLELV